MRAIDVATASAFLSAEREGYIAGEYIAAKNALYAIESKDNADKRRLR